MMKSVIFHVLAFVTGFFAAFFTILPSIFSGGGSTWESVFTFILAAVVYLTVASVYGFVNRGKRTYITLLIPGIFIVILFTFSDAPDSPARWILHLSYILIAGSCSVSGDHIGGLIKTRMENRSKSKNRSS
ncbi:MAG: hypothetical protein ACMUIG_05535 [Thermoplasmatota archaeon]